MDEIFHFKDRNQAIEYQRAMAPTVLSLDEPDFDPRLVCGLDVSYDGEKAYVAAAVWDLQTKVTIEKLVRADSASVGYYSGLLGFREGPLLFRTARQLHNTPDVFMVDGQGTAHPRKFGLACQFGIAMGRPTIGVAKSRLYGQSLGEALIDPAGASIGRIVLTPTGRKFYVSVGHRISLETASRLVSQCIVDGHPWPLRQAHLDSETAKRDKTN